MVIKSSTLNPHTYHDYIEGKITNNTGKYWSSVEMTASTYDASDKLLTSYFKFVGGIGVGETKSYAVVVDKMPGRESYKVIVEKLYD